MAAKRFLVPIDMVQLEIRQAVAHLLASAPGSPVEGQYWYNTTSHALEFENNAGVITLGRLDQITAPAADVSLNSHKITNLLDPTGAQDAATMAWVQSQVAGVRDEKDSVRITTAAALPAYGRVGNVLTASAFGAITSDPSMDGVSSPAVGDRVLVNNVGSAVGADRGIYVISVVGDGSTAWVLTRASDADSSAEMTQGAFVWTTEGTANVGSGWLLITADPITLNTTSLSFTQIATVQMLVAGAGLTKTGTTIDVVAGATPGSGGPGGGLVADANDVVVDTAVVARHIAFNVGDGAATSYDKAHNFGTKDVIARVYDLTTPFADVEVDIQHKDTNTVTVIFATAPALNAYRLVVVG